MRKSRTPGSVRGVSGNGYPYRDNIIPVFRSMDDPHFAVWTIIAQMAGAIPQTPAIADG